MAETVSEVFGPPTKFQDARMKAEERFPFIKRFRDIKIGEAKVQNKGGMGEFVEPDNPDNPFPGHFSITIGNKSESLQGGIADTVIADMIHAAAIFDPDFRQLKQELKSQLSPGELRLAKRRYEQDFKGKFSGSNFASFGNFIDSYWLDGMVQHLLLPENSEIEQIKRGNPDAVPILDKIEKLFSGE